MKTNLTSFQIVAMYAFMTFIVFYFISIFDMYNISHLSLSMHFPETKIIECTEERSRVLKVYLSWLHLSTLYVCVGARINYITCYINSQPPVILAAGALIPQPGLQGYLHSCVHTNTHIIKNKNKFKKF